MLRYLITIIVINCIFNLQSTISDEDKLKFGTNRENSIDILFSHNNQIRDDMMFTIIDSSNLGTGNNEPMAIYGSVDLKHDEYIELLNEIKRIYCQKDSNEIEGLFISFNIYEKGQMNERIRFKGLSQLKEYLLISNKILGNRNFMPLKRYIE